MGKEIDLEKIIQIAKKAGDAILKIYHNKQFAGIVDYKSDDSPLTLADKESHKIIINALKNVSDDIPVLSEESNSIDYEIRKDWKKYWLVDPLDGTKEFINRNGEFTVNIALISDRKPDLGVIYVPDKELCYYSNGIDAFKMANGENPQKIEVNHKKEELVAVKSRSHSSEEESEVLKRYDAIDSISVGSSLKFCMVAEGKADIYYRHGPTMEWDTAAGQAILEAAGGYVFSGNYPKQRFLYNKKDLRNGSFLCLGFDYE